MREYQSGRLPEVDRHAAGIVPEVDQQSFALRLLHLLKDVVDSSLLVHAETERRITQARDLAALVEFDARGARRLRPNLALASSRLELLIVCEPEGFQR